MLYKLSEHVATFIASDGSGVAFYHRLSGSTQLIAQVEAKPPSAYQVLETAFSEQQFSALFDSLLEKPERILVACINSSFIEPLTST